MQTTKAKGKNLTYPVYWRLQAQTMLTCNLEEGMMEGKGFRYLDAVKAGCIGWFESFLAATGCSWYGWKPGVCKYYPWPLF